MPTRTTDPHQETYRPAFARARRPPVAPKQTRPPVEPGRVPRVAKLMALAIRFDHLIGEGVVTNQTDLAELAHVTKPRITQIMNLLHLAPDIQEDLLNLPRTTKGKDPVCERHIRPIAATPDWRKQRKLWRAMLAVDVAGELPG